MLLRPTFKTSHIPQTGVAEPFSLEHLLPATPLDRPIGFNVQVYVAMQMALATGSRSLMPVCWAACVGLHVSHSIAMEQGLSSGRSRRAWEWLLSHMEGALYGVLRATPEIVTPEHQALLGSLSRMQSVAYKQRDAADYEEGQKPLTLLAQAARVDDATLATLSTALAYARRAGLMSHAYGEERGMVEQAMASFLGGVFRWMPPGVFQAVDALEAAGDFTVQGAWDACVAHLFPGNQVFLNLKHLPVVGVDPVAVRDRRLHAGPGIPQWAQLAEQARGLTLDLAYETLAESLNLRHVTDERRAALLPALRATRVEARRIGNGESDYVICTRYTQAEYQHVLEAGHLLGQWEIDALGELSHAHSDSPLLFRAVADARLWGEAGTYVMPASLIRADMLPVLMAQAAQEGSVLITLPRSVLAHSTVSVSELETSAFVAPATPDGIARAAFIDLLANGFPGGAYQTMPDLFALRGLAKAAGELLFLNGLDAPRVSLHIHGVTPWSPLNHEQL